jgi:uncharacterized protein YbjT (DUF2867 family)
MRVLITGAYGFLGSHIVSGLLEAGHDVVGCGRNLELAKRLLPALEWRACDFNLDIEPEVWKDRLNDIDVVINCVGIVQGTRDQSLSNIHDGAPSALFKACADVGVGRVIQISALGAGADGRTDYATTKSAADELIQTLDLDWLVLRPSLVYGQACYGGTALFRGLAGFPFFIPVMGAERRFQPIHMSDFVEAVCRAVSLQSVSKQIINLTGPEEKTAREILLAYRAWLGFRPQPVWEVPGFLGKPLLKIGDLVDWLGTRTPVTTTAFRQMEGGNTASAQPMMDAFDLSPKTLAAGFSADVSSVTDRWHARSYFLKPFLLLLLGVYWILSGLLPLLTGFQGEAYESAASLMGESPARTLAMLASLVDILLGGWLLLGTQKRIALFGQLGVSLIYLAGMSFLAPDLWTDNLAPLLKIFPAMGLAVTLLALDAQR